MNSKGLSRAGTMAAFICMLRLTATTSAQSVFSVNAIGYIDSSFVAGSNFVANPLQREVNSVSNLFGGLPHASFFVPWDRFSQNFGSTNFYSATTGWTEPAATFLPPAGALLWLPAPATVSFVGEVWQPPSLALTGQVYSAGIWVLGAMPRAGFPVIMCSEFDSCPPQPPPLDTVFSKWIRGAQRFENYTYLGVIPGFTDGWVDEMYNPAHPQLEPGEAGLFSVPSSFWVPAAAQAQSTGSSPVRLQNVSCRGSNVTFQFTSTTNLPYAVLRCTNLNENVWQVVQQESAAASNGMVTVATATAANGSAFYQVWPPITTSGPYLMNASRQGTQFQFQFYAPTGTVYEVQRTLSLGNATPSVWQTVKNVTAEPNTIVAVVDTNAVAASGYYRIQYSY